MMDRLAARWDDPMRRARLLRWLWLVSTGFTLFGFGVIFYRIFFPR
jgi:phage shock protein PspC (stress-responsive transcriptional regulator)